VNHYSQEITLMGTVFDCKEDWFHLDCRSGDRFRVHLTPTTVVTTLRNLDGIDRTRVPPVPSDEANDTGAEPTNDPRYLVRKFIRPGQFLVAQGVRQENGDLSYVKAWGVTLAHSQPDKYLFETETQWWLTQIARMADRHLDELFGDRRTYEEDEFAALYRTNLNILGLAMDDNTQEAATLSRFIYDLSAAYLLTGVERYLLAARAGVNYQRTTFRSLSHDGRYCFWAHAKRKTANGSVLIVASLNPDDAGAIPLYEQIYALAGLAMYYRVTGEWHVLHDIRRTVHTFRDFYHDDQAKGFFSHLDAATVRYDSPALGDNAAKKNWNSIGDHIPAYLINLILALKPLPEGRAGDLHEFLEYCESMLREVTDCIIEHFPSGTSPFVNERFHGDWTADHSWRWQQDRCVAGHNLKIAWNLTRVANYLRSTGCEEDDKRATRAMALAKQLADDLANTGMDQIRGGCFDCLERHPTNGMDVEFAWSNTKEFWQQEQALLAYLILYGHTKHEAPAQAATYLRLARETAMFWNRFFLDHDTSGVYFRTTDNGLPVIYGQYGNKGSHATGYHAFELGFLAHIYIRTFLGVTAGTEGGDSDFCLYFQPETGPHQQSFNSLPDFLPPGELEVAGVTVNGVPRESFHPDNFQIALSDEDCGGTVAVTLRAKRRSRGQ
jgi:mannose/cellobiose epimerase-like protein (N-acyl-D-glucosamine 2-epimerase family)